MSFNRLVNFSLEFGLGHYLTFTLLSTNYILTVESRDMQVHVVLISSKILNAGI